MNPKFEELYLLTDDGRKLPAIEIFKNNGNLFFSNLNLNLTFHDFVV